MSNDEMPLSLLEYDRIYRSIEGICCATEFPSSRSCIFFSVLGAMILDQIHGLPARIIAGAAYICVDENNEILLGFGADDDFGASDGSRFHCWVEIDHWIVDFMAPNYKDTLAEQGCVIDLERRMFQKHDSKMAKTHDELERQGGFLFIGNNDLAHSITDAYSERKDLMSLLEIYQNWYRKWPDKMEDVIHIDDSNGKIIEIRLSDNKIRGVW
ncbi:DUF2026 family protein [Anaerolineales bacterium HSG6]|nr:DUF2026 family protein [Anaerolineales bacterium HSG6]